MIRGAGFGCSCFWQMKRRSAGTRDARINKRAAFDLFSLSPSWNRFSPSHTAPEGMFFGLAQRKAMLTKSPPPRLSLTDRTHRVPRVSAAKLTPVPSSRKRCTLHPQHAPQRQQKRSSHPLNAHTHTNTSLPRGGHRRGVKNPGLRVGNLSMARGEVEVAQQTARQNKTNNNLNSFQV